MAYPDSLDVLPVDFVDGTGPRDTNPAARLSAAELLAVVNAVAAVQAELGLVPSASFATVAARLSSIESAATSLSATVAGKADLASPALTGTPTAPTQAPGNDSTRIATTAFVEARASAIDGGTA